MKRLVSTVYLAFAILTLFGQGTGKNFIDQNYIEVTGHAEKKVSPDRIYLNILINEKDFKNQSIRDIERKMINRLTEMGVDVEKNLKIKDFASNFKNYWIQKTDIQLMKEYELLLTDANTAGGVFLEFEKLGISNVSIDRLENSEIKRYELEVKIEAMKSAQEKAKAIANSISQDIGRAILIQESQNMVYLSEESLQRRYAGINVSTMSKNAEETMAPNIEFERIKLEYNIVARFELK